MKKILLALLALLSSTISLSQPTVLDEAASTSDNVTDPISIPGREVLQTILYSFQPIADNPTMAATLLEQLSGKKFLPIVAVSTIETVIGDYVAGLKNENPRANFRELLTVKGVLIEQLLKDRPACLSQLRMLRILSSVH